MAKSLPQPPKPLFRNLKVKVVEGAVKLNDTCCQSAL
jgi:hypothetical protein